MEGMIYIHIPFCLEKCIYCDFYSGGSPDWKKYFKVTTSELSQRLGELRGSSISSIYLGGGTPSLIPKEDFREFVTNVFRQISERGYILTDNLEFTVEVNPEDVTQEMASVWRDAGVNRISMGVQSLNDLELKLLKRRHSTDKVKVAYNILKQHFNNISLDLIYGIPGQDMKSLSVTLDGFLDMEPSHISAYALTYESGTPLSLFRERGAVLECSEEEYLEMDKMINDRLENSGYERYEISNYSLEGFRSRHNNGYWEGKAYLGIGPSAASFNGIRTRRTNLPDLKSYLNGDIKCASETLTDEELMEETIMVRLRTKEGLDISQFEERFGVSATSKVLNKAVRWRDSGHIGINQGRLALTKHGIAISDHIILDLIP